MTVTTLWTFRKTGRQARIIGVYSTPDQDTVSFRFVDDDVTREVLVRRFLEDFVKAERDVGPVL